MTNVAVVSETIRALAALYCAAMLEELWAFDVVDRLLERWMTGLLQIDRSGRGDSLLREWLEIRASPSDAERRDWGTGLPTSNTVVVDRHRPPSPSPLEWNEVRIVKTATIELTGESMRRTRGKQNQKA